MDVDQVRLPEPLYSVKEIAEFFHRTTAWVYWCLSNGRFVYENGDPIKPAKTSSGGGRRFYDLDGLQEMALSLYRNKQLSDEGLKEVLTRIFEEREAHR